jgi:CubicO group peptidase (beta-lactamase class C family)
MKKLLLHFAIGACFWPMLSPGQIPISGRPVPSMVAFDQLMTRFMTANSIEAGVLGIMRDDRIVYLRGFGYLDSDIPLPENAMFRQASVSKPPTAAAVRKLAEAGAFGPLGIDRAAFNLTVSGVNNNGVLDITPFGGVLGDTSYARITIRQLLDHTSGLKGPTGEGNRDVAVALGMTRPPMNSDYLRLHLSRPMLGTHGVFSYDSYNYGALGEIISRYYAAGYEACIRDLVMRPEVWIPRTEIMHGRTLRQDRDPREPWYRTPFLGNSLYDYDPPIERLNQAYGGEFEMDGVKGAGSLVASAQAMLIFGGSYLLWYPSCGVPITPTFPANGLAHTGGGPGDSTFLTAITIGTNTVSYSYAFNGGLSTDQYNLITDSLYDLIVGGAFTWPDITSDGFWVNLGAPLAAPEFGGYHAPCNGWANALNRVTDGTRLRLKPGSVTWSGRITKRLRLDAPEGIVTIGL